MSCNYENFLLIQPSVAMLALVNSLGVAQSGDLDADVSVPSSLRNRLGGLLVGSVD